MSTGPPPAPSNGCETRRRRWRPAAKRSIRAQEAFRAGRCTRGVRALDCAPRAPAQAQAAERPRSPLRQLRRSSAAHHGRPAEAVAKGAAKSQKRRAADDAPPPFAPAASALSNSLRNHSTRLRALQRGEPRRHQGGVGREELHLPRGHARAPRDALERDASARSSKDLRCRPSFWHRRWPRLVAGSPPGSLGCARTRGTWRAPLHRRSVRSQLRREVMIQGMRDTSDGCGTRDKKERRAAKRRWTPSKPRRRGRCRTRRARRCILDALQKAMALSDDGEAKVHATRHDASSPPSDPGNPRARAKPEVLDAARAGRPRDVRGRGEPSSHRTAYSSSSLRPIGRRQRSALTPRPDDYGPQSR
jgi:hypothetical protein